MRKRTLAREFALQVLYTMEIANKDYHKALEDFWANQDKDIDSTIKEFASRIVEGVSLNLKFIDEDISLCAKNWQIKRMSAVDRNILRIGVFELKFCDDVPPKVSINEAIDLAKKFSGPEAGGFVNGILDKIKTPKSK